MKVFEIVVLVLAFGICVDSKNIIGNFNADKIEQKIISGNDAKVGEIPWMVAIEAKLVIGHDFCGGALISQEWVLTSANCISRGIKYVLQFGGITTNLIEIGRVEMTSRTALAHSKFDPLTMNFDVALIKLPKKVTFNERIQAIALPKQGSVISNLVMVNVAGWGATKSGGGHSNKLHHIDLSTISNLNCQDDYGKEEIIPSTLCATGFLDATPCDDDQGGPLYTTNSEGNSTLVGIFSFYHKNGCGSHKPTVYVRTEPLLSWISSVTGIDV